MAFYSDFLNIATNAAWLTIGSVSTAAVKIATNVVHFHINGDMFYVTGKEISLATDYQGNALVIAPDMQCVLTIITDSLGNVSFEQGTQYTKHSNYNTNLISHQAINTHAILWYVYIKNEIAGGSTNFVGWTTA